MAGLKAQCERRLKKELMELQGKQPCGIKVGLIEDNLHTWEAIIPGPPDSLYSGGKFKVRICFPDTYPLHPPEIYFTTPIYHLNVNQKMYNVCFGALAQDNWTATCTIEQIIHSLYSILSKPDTSSAMDHDLLNQFHHFTSSYNCLARESAQRAK